jgi:hypothetical protein
MKWESTFLVGVRKCKMTYRKGGDLSAVWSPELPRYRSLSGQEVEQYRRGRDDLLAEVGKHLGGSVVVIET